jgi:hypothetical protein
MFKGRKCVSPGFLCEICSSEGSDWRVLCCGRVLPCNLENKLRRFVKKVRIYRPFLLAIVRSESLSFVSRIVEFYPLRFVLPPKNWGSRLLRNVGTCLSDTDYNARVTAGYSRMYACHGLLSWLRQFSALSYCNVSELISFAIDHTFCDEYVLHNRPYTFCDEYILYVLHSRPYTFCDECVQPFVQVDLTQILLAFYWGCYTWRDSCQ